MATTASSVTSTSNLDVNSIVTQLMVVERQPIDKLNLKEVSYQAKLTAYGTVKGAVSSFESAVSSLNSTAKFQSLKATPSDATVFSASASSIAVAGTHSLEVTSLAQSQKLIADAVASSTAAIGAAVTTTLTFDFGTIAGTLVPYNSVADTGGTYNAGATFTDNGEDSYNITINSDNNSLQGIRDAINAAKMGVTATIVNDGSDTPYRLSLSSDNLGETNSMRILVSGDTDIGNLLAHDPEGTQKLAETATASNANLKVDGVAVSKTSNSVSDVIQGVTLNLLKETTTPVSLTVARDTSSISTSVASFVKAYNDLAAVLKDLSSYDPNAKKGAILQGDGTVRTMQAQLRGILGSSVSTSIDGLSALSDIGVAFQKDGSLALDQTKLDTAMKNHFSDIATLFSSETGYLTSLKSWTTSLLAGDGPLANRTEGIGRSIKDIGKRRAEMESRLITIEKRYRTQFTALDSMLSSMNNTSTYLSQQLAQLSNNN